MRKIGIRLMMAGAAPLAALVLGACGAASPANKAEDPSETAVVEQRPMDVKVEASGTLQPPLIVEVKSKAGGEVLSLNAQTGDEVRKGTLLATIDPRDVRNSYAQAEADLAVAQASVQTATEQRKRSDALRKSNVITAQEYESAVLSEAQAKSQLVKAQVNLQLAQQKLSDVTIEAPINATVIEKTVEIGNIIASAQSNVSGGTTLFKIADTDTMEVKALVDETDIGRVQAGQSASVSVEAYPGRDFPGYVLKIEPEATIDQNVTMFPVIIRIDNREKLLKTGMNADVQIQVARRQNAVVVPNDAVVSMADATSVGQALGLSEDEMQKALESGFGGGMGGGPAAAGNGAAPAAGGAPAQGAAPAGAAGAGAPGAPGAPAVGAAAGAAAGLDPKLAAQCQALRQKFRSGGGPESLSADDRATMQKCRAAFMARMQGMGGGRGGFGGGMNGSGGRQRNSTTRPGVLFVQVAQEKVEPRRVTLGVNDFDYTEVLSGVKPGEKVVLATVARMRQQQNQMQDQIRQRSGGMLKGNAAPGGPVGRGPGGH